MNKFTNPFRPPDVQQPALGLWQEQPPLVRTLFSRKEYSIRKPRFANIARRIGWNISAANRLNNAPFILCVFLKTEQGEVIEINQATE